LFGKGEIMAATHGVALTWLASASLDVTGYNVYKFVGACAPGVVFVKLASTTVGVVTYTDNSVVAGATYCYAVTAVSPGGESPNNGELQVEIPLYIAPTLPLPPGGSAGVVS
jgi:hypothetical protein